jgi:hypothetical protein
LGKNDITVRPVSGRGDFRNFINYAYERNRGDGHWVPPLRIGERERLRPKKNPFFAHADVQLLLAFREGRSVGRTAASTTTCNETHRDNPPRSGSSKPRTPTRRALLDEVERWHGSAAVPRCAVR